MRDVRPNILTPSGLEVLEACGDNAPLYLDRTCIARSERLTPAIQAFAKELILQDFPPQSVDQLVAVWQLSSCQSTQRLGVFNGLLMSLWIDLCIDTSPALQTSARRCHDRYHRLEDLEILV